MNIQHFRITAFGIAIAGAVASAVWGHSLIIDIVAGVVAVAIGIAVADSIRRT